MEETPMTQDELNSELTGLNKGQKDKKKIQLLIGIGAAGILILLIVIIIIIVATSSKSKKNKEVIGEIKCTLDVSNSNIDTDILGEEFDKKN